MPSSTSEGSPATRPGRTSPRSTSVGPVRCSRRLAVTAVKRVVVASSNHAVGFHVRGPVPLADDVAPLPDSLYGVSKAAGEALCEFYSREVLDEHRLSAYRVVFRHSREPSHVVHVALARRFRPADKGIADDRAPRLPARVGSVGEHAPLVVHCGRRGHRLPSRGRRRELRRAVSRKPPRARVRRGSHDLGTQPATCPASA